MAGCRLTKRLGMLMLALVMALGLGLSGAPQPQPAAADFDLRVAALSPQAQSDMTQFGVDVSQWQGVIDWEAVASGVNFAIVRCGFGNDERKQDDKMWLANAAGCQQYGIPMGVYLYSYATSAAMAKSEAAHVIRCLEQAGLDQSKLAFPIYLDMEDASTNGFAPARYAAIFNAFKGALDEAGYSKVGVYANCSWWDGNLSTIELAADYRWVAHFNPVFCEGYPEVEAKGCGIWQYTSGAKVSGIRGRVDGNYARIDLPFLGFGEPGVGAGQADSVQQVAVAPNNNQKGKPRVFHLYYPLTGDRIYTTDSDERTRLELGGWTYKGTVGKVPRISGVPVYRFYKYSTQAHYFTTSKAKYRSLNKKKGWLNEGIVFYSQAKKLGKPVYRVKKGGMFRYVVRKDKRDKLVKAAKWKKKGVGWYAVK